MAEVQDEHFVDGGNDHLPKGLVGSVILVEDGGGNVMGISKVDDLGALHDGRYGVLGAKVNGSDEGRGRECCVHDGRDVELHQSECAASQV